MFECQLDEKAFESPQIFNGFSRQADGMRHCSQAWTLIVFEICCSAHGVLSSFHRLQRVRRRIVLTGFLRLGKGRAATGHELSLRLAVSSRLKCHLFRKIRQGLAL